MKIHLVLGPLQLFVVLGRVYDVRDDDFQRTCLRMVWRGQPRVRWG